MSNIRIFDIPDEVLENESYKRISRRLNATKKTDRDLCNHIISTANFVYMYCTQYEKEDTVDRSDAFVAALLFNFWKIIAKGDGKYVVVYWWWNHNLCVRYVYLLKAGLNMEINRKMEILSCR